MTLDWSEASIVGANSASIFFCNRGARTQKPPLQNLEAVATEFGSYIVEFSSGITVEAGG
jgi:hypothetical protein